MKNPIAFFEIPVTDFYQSVNFYQAILGEELMVAEYGNEKMACFVQDGQTIGAVSYAPDFKPSKHGVLITLTVKTLTGQSSKYRNMEAK